jgi:hypothetical protein
MKDSCLHFIRVSVDVLPTEKQPSIMAARISHGRPHLATERSEAGPCSIRSRPGSFARIGHARQATSMGLPLLTDLVWKRNS